ncbi:MAG: hypothetical protein HQL87_18810 [Magnetococcales bacterium]|nr:hypothetical protein [Magnetococcales bacterium]
MSTIPVIVASSAADAAKRTHDWGSSLGGGAAGGPMLVDTAQLRANLSGLSNQIADLLQDIHPAGGFALQEVKVQVEISAEGGVALVGNSTAGTQGGITLTYVRRPLQND